MKKKILPDTEIPVEPKHDNITCPVSTASHTNLLKRENFHGKAGPTQSALFVVHS